MTDEQTELEHRDRTRFKPGCLVLAIISGLSLYPLSIPFVIMFFGPIYKSRVLQIIYTPLGYLARLFPAVDDAIEWYIALFPPDWTH